MAAQTEDGRSESTGGARHGDAERREATRPSPTPESSEAARPMAPGTRSADAGSPLPDWMEDHCL